MSTQSLRRRLATSDRPLPRLLRRVYRRLQRFSVPAPRLVVRPALWVFLALRSGWHWFKRVFICEPFFKAYCERYGKHLRTGIFLHWIEGRGSIILGDDVWLDGKSSFSFASRFTDRPTLEIGDHSGVGHNCVFVVGKRIRIGRRCVISGDCVIFDSSGHSTDVAARRAGAPPPPDEVREVVIGDDVWIARRVIVFPGVHIGDGSVISSGSVVRTHVPPYAVVAGNPAQVVFRLKPPGAAGGGPTPSA
jgi:acetyltransferase-like isoleucine patch superfamily enzyme